MENDFYNTLATVQATHWWYSARRTILSRLLSKEFARGVPEGIIYDLGCGVGNNLETLSKFGETLGIDPSPEAINICKARGHSNVIIGRAEEITSLRAPKAGVIILTDVLEHVEDDAKCLRDISSVLPANGLAVVTVPAFSFLWGPSDEKSHHFRRYTKPRLRKIIEPYFSIELFTYFNFFLFAPIAVGRIFERILDRPGDEGAAVPPSWINYLLQKTMESELCLIEQGLVPFGVSLLAVLRKKGNATQ